MADRPVEPASVAYIVAGGGLLPLKCDMASMSHPLFALRAGDKRVRAYNHNGVTVTVLPGATGCATIHDKDLWIYCISEMVEAKNLGRAIERTIRFTAYDFLRATGRGASGRAYERMAGMLARLSGTRVETNIETDGRRERAGFGLVDSWSVVAEAPDSERMVAVEVTLPDWLYRSVDALRVLTLSRDYFRLRAPLDRRIYELVRKHCGYQPRWRVTLGVLHLKSGSTGAIREFRRQIKLMARAKTLLDYRMIYDVAADAATFYAVGRRTNRAARLAMVADTLPRIRAGVPVDNFVGL
ncbi:MAG TPA: replication initiator protein A [Nevskiaceae bacterium]|nr:replication initiator protein A [Nevskiaceae bacterium]